MKNEPLIPTHGGCRRLKGFLVSQLAYDVTVRFVDRYIDRFGRVRDQMVQAAFQNVSIACEPSGGGGDFFRGSEEQAGSLRYVFPRVGRVCGFRC